MISTKNGIVIDWDNKRIKLDEKTHNYYLDDHLIEGESTTEIMGAFSDFSFDMKWDIQKNILRAIGGEVKRLVWGVEVVEKHCNRYMEKRQQIGTFLHNQIEVKKLAKAEEKIKTILKLNGFKEGEYREYRELKFYNQPYNIASTVDYLAIDDKKRKIILIDYKVTKQDKRQYLTAQLNIYHLLLDGNWGTDVNNMIPYDFELHGLIINDKTKKIEIVNLENNLTLAYHLLKAHKELKEWNDFKDNDNKSNT